MSPDKKSLKILIPVLAFSSAGGMRVLSKLADRFIDMGHEVSFLGSERINKPYYPTRAGMKFFYNPLHQLPVVRGLCNLFFMFIYLVKNRRDYDVVLANYNLTAFPVSMATLGTAKGFYYIQAYEPEFYSRRTVIGFFAYYISTLSYYLPIYKIVNGGIYKKYKSVRATDVVEPGINLGQFMHQPKLRTGPIVEVGCIGRKLEWKGTSEIIQAVNDVRTRTGVDLRLNVAFELPSKIDASSFPFINLSLPHGDEKLAHFYRQSSLFIATGLLQDNAFHYPCLEAMASGCAVISNYSPGNETNAFYLSKVTSDKITQAILDYLDTDEVQLRAKIDRAQKDVLAYDWSVVAKKMILCFEKRLNLS